MSTAGTGPVILCYDGSEGAARAIEHAGGLLGGGPALVVCVWEAIGEFSPTNPIGAYVSVFNKPAHELDAIAAEISGETARTGVEIATRAGFDAEPLPARAEETMWGTILAIAADRDAPVIVCGSRGLSGIKARLLGGVSGGIVHDSDRPVLVVPSAVAAQHRKRFEAKGIRDAPGVRAHRW